MAPDAQSAGSLKILLRLLVVLIFGILLGAGIYLGIPWLYRATIVPVQQHTDAIADLTQRLTQAETQSDRATGALQDRTAGLEGEIVELQETAAVQSAGVATAVARVTDLEAKVAELASVSEAQGNAQTALEKDIETATRDLRGLASDLRDQQEALKALDEAATPRLEDLEARADALALTQDDALGRLALLQAAQDLVRVQLLLIEDNVGAAGDALQIVVAHLTRYGALAPDQGTTVADLVTRVETLAPLIAERSFRATPLLEALWTDIVALALPPLPEVTAPVTELGTSGTLTSTTGLTATVDLTSTVGLTATQTVTPTLTPTPTPRP